MNSFDRHCVNRTTRGVMLCLLSLVLTACYPFVTEREKLSRMCSEFDLPEFSDWPFAPDGTALMFMTAAGDTMEYDQVSDLRPGPELQTEFFLRDLNKNPSDVTCTKRHEYVYISRDGSTRIEATYRQSEDYLNQPYDEQKLSLNMLFFRPADSEKTIRGSSFGFSLAPLRLQSEGVTYFPTAVIGGKEYQDVILDADFNTQYPPTPNLDPVYNLPVQGNVHSIKIARHAGVLEFSLDNGLVLTRIDALNP